MHESLILPESNFPSTKTDIITYHGKEYFSFTNYYPEKSGLYEILVSYGSPFRFLIEIRQFIPLIYYDSKEHVWTHGGKKIDIKSIQPIGWRLFI